MIADPDSEIDRRQAAAASLRTLMRLPVAQRSSVILMDVLGHSLEEIGGVLDSTVPAVKAALHRGRAGCASWRRSRTTGRRRSWPRPTGRALPPMSRASTPAISMPCATCWPTK